MSTPKRAQKLGITSPHKWQRLNTIDQRLRAWDRQLQLGHVRWDFKKGYAERLTTTWDGLKWVRAIDQGSFHWGKAVELAKELELEIRPQVSPLEEHLTLWLCTPGGIFGDESCSAPVNKEHSAAYPVAWRANHG